jgi:hypothetical protein
MVCSGVPSWPGRMIGRCRAARRQRLQLRLDLGESPAPAAALWELVGEEQRRAALAQLAALIARTVAGEEERDE